MVGRGVHRAARTATDRPRLQAICAGLLVAGLIFDWAEIRILGLFLVVLAAAFTGVSDEHRLGKAFTEDMPLTALLVVFCAIVAMIAEQGLFRPAVGPVYRAVNRIRPAPVLSCATNARASSGPC